MQTIYFFKSVIAIVQHRCHHVARMTTREEKSSHSITIPYYSLLACHTANSVDLLGSISYVRNNRNGVLSLRCRCPITGAIATACGDNYVRIFVEQDSSNPNEPEFACVTSIQAHDQDVNAVQWNTKIGGLLASCSDDGDVKIWRYMS